MIDEMKSMQRSDRYQRFVFAESVQEMVAGNLLQLTGRRECLLSVGIDLENGNNFCTHWCDAIT